MNPFVQFNRCIVSSLQGHSLPGTGGQVHRVPYQNRRFNPAHVRPEHPWGLRDSTARGKDLARENAKNFVGRRLISGERDNIP